VTKIDWNARYFTKMDAMHGYWQMDLHEDSRDLTYFITPLGAVHPLAIPIGIYCYTYNLRQDQAFESITGIQKIVNDMLVANISFPTHVEKVREVLDRCREFGITLNPDKFSFACAEVTFVGYKISKAGIQADPEKVKAIQQFPEPSNHQDLRSFMGLVNQLG
jgi:hypothetical protein